MKTTLDLEQAMLSPSTVFEAPDEVLTAPDLSHEERHKILEQWKLDAQRLEESANENMTGGERSRLSEVSKALTALDEKKRQEAA
jgi:hypothetical protein